MKKKIEFLHREQICHKRTINKVPILPFFPADSQSLKRHCNNILNPSLQSSVSSVPQPRKSHLPLNEQIIYQSTHKHQLSVCLLRQLLSLCPSQMFLFCLPVLFLLGSLLSPAACLLLNSGLENKTNLTFIFSCSAFEFLSVQSTHKTRI